MIKRYTRGLAADLPKQGAKGRQKLGREMQPLWPVGAGAQENLANLPFRPALGSVSVMGMFRHYLQVPFIFTV
jgi:hypothetical protein